MMHSATEVFLTCYFVLNAFNFFRAYTFGMVSYGRCKLVVFGFVPLQILGLLWFRTTFVVKAEDSMIGHGLPFMLLQVSLCSVELQNYWFRQAVCECSRYNWKLHLAYVAALCGTTGFKLLINFFALAGRRLVPAEVARVVDILWMLLAAVIPLGLAYFWRKDAPPESYIDITYATLGNVPAPFVATVEKLSERVRNFGYVRRLQSLATSCATVLTIWWIITNIAKVPFYLLEHQPATNVSYPSGDPPFGMESTIVLRWAGYRSKKIAADPLLFLAPHTVMGCTMLGMWVLVLAGKVDLKRLSPALFAVAAVFAAHIIPVRNGVPNRELDLPINELLCAIIFTACAVGSYALYYFRHNSSFSRKMLKGSWAGIVFSLALAPLSEMKGYVSNTIQVCAYACACVGTRAHDACVRTCLRAQARYARLCPACARRTRVRAHVREECGRFSA